MSHNETDQLADSIAIVGLACRFPGSPNAETYWSNLRDGVECIKQYSDEELREAGIDDATMEHPNYVKANPEIDGFDQFDASFFGLRPTIAQITDPQQRVFLECAWEALESAGYDAERYQGDIGVFAGLSINTYLLQTYATNRKIIDSIGEFQTAMGNRGDHLATLTCYKLNLKGPGITTQSTCSTSLTSVHLATQCLLDYQTDMAIAGGVSGRVPQRSGYMYQEGGVASPDGHCRPFDADASGTVFGSGSGAVVLKRLEDAIADNDNILAVIKGSAINNDGSQKIGYTAPSIEGQQRVIRMALANADVDPSTIDYIEAHGTGTPLGDPVEIEALTKAFRSKTDKSGYCAIGSVKSNIGHLDTASGIAGLIKTILSLSNKKIPPSLNFTAPNPKINFSATPFFVNTELRDWPKQDHPRRAGVSSFGIGGTNVHIVLEEAPAKKQRNSSAAWQVLPVSAKTPLALEGQTSQIKEFLEQNPLTPIADVAYTLQAGRKVFDYRRVIIGSNDSGETIQEIKALSQHRAYTAHQEPIKRPVAFMFSAMGSQDTDMAADLYENIPEFREQLNTCIETLDANGELRIKEVLLAPAGTHSADQYSSATLIEPAIFAMEYALAKTWIKWGIEPHSVMGDGIGEYVAAAIAGVLTLSEIQTLLLTRRECLEQLPAGGMLVVHRDKELLMPALVNHPQIEFAGLNRDCRCIVSGALEAIEAFAAELDQQDTVYQRLHINCALNGSATDAVIEKMAQISNSLNHRTPEVPMISSVTGAVINSEQLNNRYWARQLREPKRISEVLSYLLENEEQVMLEVGPGSLLMNIARLHPSRTTKHAVLGSLFRPDPECTESRALLTTLGRLWLTGQSVAWEHLHNHENPGRIALPTYPFERKRYWIDPPKTSSEDNQPLERESNADNWFYTPSWKQSNLAVLREVENRSTTTQQENLLLFSDIGSLNNLLVERLQKSHWNITQVVAEADMRPISPATLVMKSKELEDYENLFAALSQQNAIPDKIIYAWPLLSRTTDSMELSVKESSFFNDFWSLVSLAKALGKHCHNKKVQLIVVSSGIHRVLGNETIDPLKASLSGPCRVIPQEYPNIRCQCIDVVLPRPGEREETTLVNQLMTEINTSTNDTAIAYRGRHRWTQTYEPVEVKTPQNQNMGLRDQGVYLITGGLGGLGLTLAKHLATKANAKLVLMSRSAPTTDNGENILSADHPALANKPELQKDLQEIVNLGAEVLITRADVSNPESVASAIDNAIEHFGSLHGIVHAAGAPGQSVMQLMSAENAKNVFLSKVTGTLVLEQVLTRKGRGEDLDFILLCGSRTAVLGGFGQADYVSANAFLDSFSEYKQPSDMGVFTIDWCGLKDIGMLANAANKAASATIEPIESSETNIVQIGHPLLHRQMYTSDHRRVYETDFAVHTHWVLSDHQISGDPVIPGTTYLEMVRAAFDDQLENHELDISEVYFLTPLRVKEDERRTTTLRRDWEGDCYRFLVESRETGGAHSTVQKHVVGKVKTLEKVSSTALDIDAIISRCSNRLEVFTDEDAVIDDHGPRWQNVKKVYHGDNEMFTVMELSDEFSSDLEDFKIHPSLLDKSIGTGRGFDLGDVPLIPYSYKRLHYKNAFSKSIYVYTQSQGVESNYSETPAFDVTIMDKQGNILVEIDSFCLKRVNDVSEMYKTLAKSQETESKSAIDNNDDLSSLSKEQVYQKLMDEEGISQQEVCDIFDRIIARSGISQFIVSTKNLPKLLEQGMIHTRSATKKSQKAKTPVLVAPEVMHPRPALQVPFVAAENDTQKKIATIWQNLLGIEEIGIDDNFFDLGGDSVVSIQIAGALNDEFGIEVPVVQLFDAPTINALSEFFAPAEQELVTEDSARESRGSRRRNRAMQRKSGA